MESSRTPTKSPPTVPQVFDLLLPREEMAVNFVVPKVNLLPSFSFFTATLYFLRVYLLSIFLLLSFSLLFQSSNFWNWARKLSFLPNNPNLQCLGPLGDPDPTDLVNAEINRIPFKVKNFSLDLWKDTFWSWPNPTKRWKDWFLRVSNTILGWAQTRPVHQVVHRRYGKKWNHADSCFILLVRHVQRLYF